MILFLRTSHISVDSRMMRYCRALARAGMVHAAAFWDRDDGAQANADMPMLRFPLHIPLGYANRRATALGLIRVNLFLMLTIWRRRHQIALVHAIDLDTAVAAWIMKRVAGTRYVYDVYDHYADSRGLDNPWRGLLARLEARVIRGAEATILADDCRREQHPPIAPGRLLVVENVPEARPARVVRTPPPAGPRLRIGYLGTFEARFRGLEDIIAAVEANPGLELEIAGAGAAEGEIVAAAARCPRITLHPPLSHADGLAMLARCDVMAGLYYADVPNHRFAAPNKYYEHLLVGRPLLTSANTPPGRKVAQHDTGWVVDDGPEPVAAALAEALADRAVVAHKGASATALWDKRYAGYFAERIGGDYVAIIRTLAARRRTRRHSPTRLPVPRHATA